VEAEGSIPPGETALNIASTLVASAQRHPRRFACYAGTRPQLDYNGWARRVARMANGLIGLGCVAGDRVVICCDNRPDYISLLYACWHAGLCAVPVNRRLHAEEIHYIASHAEARLCIADAGALAALTALGLPGDLAGLDIDGVPFMALAESEAIACATVDPASPAWLFYTSGTTGRPKGAILTHRNLTAMCLGMTADFGTIGIEDNVLLAAPLSHGAGLYALPFVMHGAGLIFPPSGAFDEQEIIDLTAYHRSVSMFLVPTMISRLLRAPHIAALPVEHLRQIIYGGAPMPLPDLRRALDRFGLRLAQLYGAGETPMTITMLPAAAHADRRDANLRSAGHPRAAMEVAIRDTAGTVLDTGEIGEVCVRGDTVMAGYWRDPEASAQALRDGWLHTGDLGRFDVAGRLTLTGRSKEMIISGGSNIYPREVEEALVADERIVEAAVIGVPDAEWGEKVVAFVTLAPGADLDATAVREICALRTARYKLPKHVVFGSLPRTAIGKIDKLRLRADFPASPIGTTA
jgi:long-chain acyl-CoA synthetase